MFLTIDNWLFDKIFQPFTDWFFERYKQGPMWLACTCGYLICLATLMKILFLPRGLHTIIDVCFTIWTFFHFRKLEARNLAVKSGTMNVRRHGYEQRVSRMTIFYLTLFMAVFILQDTSLFFLFSQCFAFGASLYFGACEEKPPAPPKKKESEAKFLTVTS
jgi:hypothetical protein